MPERGHLRVGSFFSACCIMPSRLSSQELRAKLLTEAEQSARQNAAVAMKWADLFSIEVPQELYEQIETQRQACERIISSKDRLILGEDTYIHVCHHPLCTLPSGADSLLWLHFSFITAWPWTLRYPLQISRVS